MEMDCENYMAARARRWPRFGPRFGSQRSNGITTGLHKQKKARDLGVPVLAGGLKGAGFKSALLPSPLFPDSLAKRASVPPASPSWILNPGQKYETVQNTFLYRSLNMVYLKIPVLELSLP